MERAGVAPVNAGSTTGTSFPLRCSELRTLRDDARSPCDALPAILQSQTCRRCASPAFCLFHCLCQRRSEHFGTSPWERRGAATSRIATNGVSILAILAGYGVAFTAEVPGQRHATPVGWRPRCDRWPRDLGEALRGHIPTSPRPRRAAGDAAEDQPRTPCRCSELARPAPLGARPVRFEHRV